MVPFICGGTLHLGWQQAFILLGYVLYSHIRPKKIITEPSKKCAFMKKCGK